MIVRNKECELVALVDIKEKSALGMNCDNIPFFSSLDEFLDSKIDVDVINITSPNGFHAKQAMICLAEKKHIVIEKPMALTKQDAENIIFKALQVQRLVFAVMQNRYSPLPNGLKILSNQAD